MTEYNDAVAHTVEMIRLFRQEFEEACEALRGKEETPYDRRTFVRAFFSGFEASLNGVAYGLTKTAAAETGKLSSAEMALLKEETYDLNLHARRISQHSAHIRNLLDLGYSSRDTS